MRMYPEPTGEVRMSLSLRFAAGSHDGMIREHNEDSGYAGPRLLAVADGMGGQAAGEVASSEVISTIVRLDEDIPGSDILTELGNAVQRANEQLRMMVEDDAQLEGMGTTLTALLWTGQRLGLVHVGDSRAYLLRDGALSQITQDHTWVQRLVDEGRITEEEATTHPQRSLLMRALGSGDHVEPDLSIREVRAGDRYLLCSDGLSGVVSHQTMEETLAAYQGPQETVQELIRLALNGGGPDNITCIVADVLDVDDGDTVTSQLNDTPVIVGAVAENQHQFNDTGSMQTPAGRAAELRRAGRSAVPAQQAGGAPPEGFGPPGSGNEVAAPPPGGAFGPHEGDDLTKPERRRGSWVKRSLYIGLALAVVGGGLYGGYRWTQTQYYVGAKGDHVALYQGITQDLAWISLSSVEREYPEIPLAYLPDYSHQDLQEGITANSREDAENKIASLQEQACQAFQERQESSQPPAGGTGDKGTGDKEAGEKEAGEQEAGEEGNRERGGGAGDQAGHRSAAAPQAVSPHQAVPAADPSPGPGSSDEQQLAQHCTTP